MNSFVEAEPFIGLGTALAIGLLIGVERGWEKRKLKEGKRLAGLRTYGLTGLMGGASGLLAEHFGVQAFGFVFLGFAAAVIVSHALQQRVSDDISMTSLVTMLFVFLLGSLATAGQITPSAAAAVVTAMLLRYKDFLHTLISKLEKRELHAALQLLLISIVVLPVLPNQGYGPWEALNPYEIWLMVVLISSVSFSGYFAMKFSGTNNGVLLAALAAGMVSSTALTLHYARLSKMQPGIVNILSSGILIACGTMFPRVVLVSSIINPQLFEVLIFPMSVMMVITFSSAVFLWTRAVGNAPKELTQLINPLELKTALIFTALLVLVIMLGTTATKLFGESGVYLLAAVSGFADVDPINLTLSRMSRFDLSEQVAVMGIVIASSSNTIVKAGLAVMVGCKGLHSRVLMPLLIAMFSGLICALFTQPIISYLSHS